MSRQRNLGGRDQIYPLLPRCKECGHARPAKIVRHLHPAHWPWCSKADREQMALWQRRGELRELRTARRVEDVEGSRWLT